MIGALRFSLPKNLLKLLVIKRALLNQTMRDCLEVSGLIAGGIDGLDGFEEEMICFVYRDVFKSLAIGS